MRKFSLFILICLVFLAIAEFAVFLHNRAIRAEVITDTTEYKDYLEAEWVKIPDQNRLPDPFAVDAKKAAELVKLYFPEDLDKIRGGMMIYDSKERDCFIVLYKTGIEKSMKKVVIDKNNGGILASYVVGYQ